MIRRRIHGWMMFAACGGGTATDSDATSAGADTGSATATSTMGTSGEVPTGTSGSTGAGATSEGSTAASTAGSTAATSEGTTGAEPVAWAPTLIGREFLCRLIAREHLGDPAENHTQTRFNLTGADLGVPVVAEGTLSRRFGDTIGHREIWPIGDDAVARMGRGREWGAELSDRSVDRRVGRRRDRRALPSGRAGAPR